MRTTRVQISALVVRCLDSIAPIYICYSQNFKALASLRRWAGRFESYLVGNPEDRFSHDVARIKNESRDSLEIIRLSKYRHAICALLTISLSIHRKPCHETHWHLMECEAKGAWLPHPNTKYSAWPESLLRSWKYSSPTVQSCLKNKPLTGRVKASISW